MRTARADAQLKLHCPKPKENQFVSTPTSCGRATKKSLRANTVQQGSSHIPSRVPENSTGTIRIIVLNSTALILMPKRRDNLLLQSLCLWNLQRPARDGAISDSSICYHLSRSERSCFLFGSMLADVSANHHDTGVLNLHLARTPLTNPSSVTRPWTPKTIVFLSSFT